MNRAKIFQCRSRHLETSDIKTCKSTTSLETVLEYRNSTHFRSYFNKERCKSKTDSSAMSLSRWWWLLLCSISAAKCLTLLERNPITHPFQTWPNIRFGENPEWRFRHWKNNRKQQQYLTGKWSASIQEKLQKSSNLKKKTRNQSGSGVGAAKLCRQLPFCIVEFATVEKSLKL